MNFFFELSHESDSSEDRYSYSGGESEWDSMDDDEITPKKRPREIEQDDSDEDSENSDYKVIKNEEYSEDEFTENMKSIKDNN